MLKAYGKIWGNEEITVVFATSIERAAAALDVIGDPEEGGISELPDEYVNGLTLHGKMTLDKDDGEIESMEYTMVEDLYNNEAIEDGILNGEYISLTKEKQ